MHLRSITLKGFKSFPDRTRLEFSPGVSVVIGPNGSGKSNITDAVLWALGEQSPLAVRGQTMQDVIFSGGKGVPSRNAAEIEVVIDDADFEMEAEFAEVSIARRLDRSGEGEYRLNGARCRLIDVMEALSDTGLGKEMHSVVSQGRVEAIIHSRPHERRLLIEEAAGLGKHRKRRRRAELKLARTSDNLSRALDVEREARSRIRPLKRQAEAAELRERIERQSLEARLELARDGARSGKSSLASAERAAAKARREYDEVERRLVDVAARRSHAEEKLTERARIREDLSRRLFAATAAIDRVDVRLERARDAARAAARVEARSRLELEAPRPATRAGGGGEQGEATRAGEHGLAELAERAAEASRGAAEAAGRARARLVEAIERDSPDPMLTTLLEDLERTFEAIDAASDAIGELRRLATGSGERASTDPPQGPGRAGNEAERWRARLAMATALGASAERVERALDDAAAAIFDHREQLQRELASADSGEDGPGAELRALAREEAEVHAFLKTAAEAVTGAEVVAQGKRDGAAEVLAELRELAGRLGVEAEPASEPLEEAEREQLKARIARLERRREQLGPVNPLARQEYEEAVRRVEELSTQREDLDAALAELEQLIEDIDRRIRDSFERTFAATAQNFEEVIEELFPGGRGRLRLVTPGSPRPVIGGAIDADSAEGEEESTQEVETSEAEPGVEVEVTPAGKSMRRLSLLSGGEKSLVALAFLFAVFLARACPFYILDEVEAALDDRNIDRFLRLVRRCSERAQFIVVTHQKRTMEAADCIYGVSMGEDGVSRVVSRRLAPARHDGEASGSGADSPAQAA